MAADIWKLTGLVVKLSYHVVYSEEKGSFWFRPEKEREMRAPSLGLSAPATELGST